MSCEFAIPDEEAYSHHIINAHGSVEEVIYMRIM